MMDFAVAHAPILAIAVPLVGAFLTTIVENKRRGIQVFLELSATLISLGLVLMMSLKIPLKGAITYTLGSASTGVTLPSGYALPIRIILQIDALSVYFAAIVLFVAIVALIYSISFLKSMEHSLERYGGLMLIMVAGMLGMLFTGDLFNMFIFFELLSIASCGLIAFRVHRGESSEAAFKYLIIAALAGLFILFSCALLYGQYNALNIAALASLIQFTVIDKAALALLVAAFAMKAGSVPMHMWVPDAYGEAPAPVALMLISSAIISLYALARVCFALFGVEATSGVIAMAIIALGALSMFVGVTMALIQNDIKRFLAYHSVSQMGYILMALGVGLISLASPGGFSNYGVTAIAGGLFHAMNYTFYHGLLFLCAGAIQYSLHTRDMSQMNGLARRMPITAGLFAIGALAIVGMPPLNGFVSKFLIHKSVFAFNPLLSVLVGVVSLLTLFSFTKMFYGVFLGSGLQLNLYLREAPNMMILGMLLLGGVIIVLSIFPNMVLDGLVVPAMRALLGQADYVSAVLGAAT